MFWQSYSWGYKSKQSAQEFLAEEVSERRLSEVNCKIESYMTPNGRRWQIKELI